MLDARILIVEDEPISQAILEEILQQAGYQMTLTERAEAAWQLLKSASPQFDVVLLDRNLPDMNGLDLLERIKADPLLMRIPVIMQTAMTSREEVQAGLLAGAHYYLTKPFDHGALLAIVQAAVKDYRDFLQLQMEARQSVSVLSLLTQAQFSFRTPKQARDIAVLLASICIDGQRIVLGLSELLINAVEHGNLGITYKDKSRLLQSDRWQEEIDLRLTQQPYCERTAMVSVERDALELKFVIRDEGEGFDWHAYLEMSPDRAFDMHGRGIAVARMLCFDQLEYIGNGNEVRAAIKL